MATCVHVSKRLPEAKYRKIRTQTLLNKVLGLFCDTYAKVLESHYAIVLSMRGLVTKENWST